MKRVVTSDHSIYYDCARYFYRFSTPSQTSTAGNFIDSCFFRKSACMCLLHHGRAYPARPRVPTVPNSEYQTWGTEVVCVLGLNLWSTSPAPHIEFSSTSSPVRTVITDLLHTPLPRLSSPPKVRKLPSLYSAGRHTRIATQHSNPL